ncbi:MAG: response regulator [Chitinophagaceae bacterium]|nr:MAG: response regulator [Chitinophagaceae bacterium]
MSKVIHILMVEDDPLDVMDIRRTLDKMKIVYHLHHARNGEEGLRLLRDLGSEQPAIEPDVALIDINMPKMNGLEFLQALRADERWKGLKCFMITTSDEPLDRQAAKNLGVSGYIVKPFKVNNPSSMDSFNLMIDLMNMRG